MTTFHYIVAFISAFMLGMLFTVNGLPWVIDFFKKRIKTGSYQAEYLLERSAKFNSKKIRRSKVFKNRLKIILEIIEDAAKKGEESITITYLDNCHTDLEMRNILNEKGFHTYVNFDGINSLRIKWEDKR